MPIAVTVLAESSPVSSRNESTALQLLRDEPFVVPGLVYRRDSVARFHAGEPHQVDLWRVRQGDNCTHDDDETLGDRVRTSLDNDVK